MREEKEANDVTVKVKEIVLGKMVELNAMLKKQADETKQGEYSNNTMYYEEDGKILGDAMLALETLKKFTGQEFPEVAHELETLGQEMGRLQTRIYGLPAVSNEEGPSEAGEPQTTQSKSSPGDRGGDR